MPRIWMLDSSGIRAICESGRSFLEALGVRCKVASNDLGEGGGLNVEVW